jgi:arylformamidase
MIYDLTRPLENGMDYFPGDPIPSFIPIFHETFRITEIVMGSHTGTHLDAPAHYLHTGTTIDSLSLDSLIGPCFILKLEDPQIYETDLHPFEKEIISSSRLLIHAGENAGLMPCAAQWLASRCRCVGIDSLSISCSGYDAEVHTALMQLGVVILEGLHFRVPLHGEYILIALPLLLSGADGAPARVIVCDPDHFRTV